MKQKSIQEINEIYDLEIDRVVGEIKKEKAKKVLLQFPEGLKPYAQTIADYLEKQTSAQFFIWLDSCFGGCDVPLEIERLGVDLTVQFGHSEWKF